MSTLKDISKPVENHLNDFGKFFKSTIKSDVALLNLIISYITRKKGKRVRPLLVFLSAELCGGVNERSYTGASMVELLHTATLIHDDVVDESQERRGMASINSSWNNKIAVLIGDYLLARGLLTSIDQDEFKFLKALSYAVQRMSEGELLQIQKSKDFDTDEKTYYKIISRKTASLMASCCEIGAISASNDADHHKALKEYGEFLGMSFQIRDDIFDYKSSKTKIGKPVGNDLKEKKLTLPIIHSFSKATKKEIKEISGIIKKGELSRKNLKRVLEFVTGHGGLDYAEKKAIEFQNKAVESLKSFDDSPTKQSLINFSAFVIERNK